jgi:hypothetical protein
MTTPYGLASMKRTLSYANGWAAEMVYCLPSNQVIAHIAANYLLAFPGTTNLHVSQIVDEPWMDGDCVDSTGMSDSRKLTYSFALDYLDVPWPSLITRPAYLEGTTLRLEARFSGQFLTLPARALQSGSSYTPSTNPDGSPYVGPPITPPPPPPNSNNRILIPLIDYLVEWDRVQDLSALDWDGEIGYVNATTFLGCEPETLLLEGVSLAPSFVLNPSNPHAWKATATLKKRKIQVDGNIYGWNHDFLPNPPGWTTILMADGTPRYQFADFTNLFTGARGP